MKVMCLKIRDVSGNNQREVNICNWIKSRLNFVYFKSMNEWMNESINQYAYVTREWSSCLSAWRSLVQTPASKNISKPDLRLTVGFGCIDCPLRRHLSERAILQTHREIENQIIIIIITFFIHWTLYWNTQQLFSIVLIYSIFMM